MVLLSGPDGSRSLHRGDPRGAISPVPQVRDFALRGARRRYRRRRIGGHALKRKLLLLTVPIVVVAASVSFAAGIATAEPRVLQAPTGIALAPLGDFPSAKAEALAAMIRRRYKVQ